MIHPTSGIPEPPAHPPAKTDKAELTLQQRTVLERLITRLMTLTSQKNIEIWAGVKHDLGLKDAPLLARHFSAAKNNLNQRITVAQQNQQLRQTRAQLNELLNQGNNRQLVSDYIRQHFGQTTLHSLTSPQLHQLLETLQSGQISLPPASPHPARQRPLLVTEHHALNQQVIRLAAASGESDKQIWHTMLTLCHVKSAEHIPASHFVPLTDWLHARQTLSTQHDPTLMSLQTALQHPLEASEWQKIIDFARDNWQVTPQMTLSSSQIETLLSTIFALQVASVHRLSTSTSGFSLWQWQKSWRIWLALALLLMLLWLVKDY